jgi:hypothetical protein
VNAAHANPEPWVKTAGLTKDNNNTYDDTSDEGLTTVNLPMNIAKFHAKLKRLNIRLNIYPAILIDRGEASQQLANALEAAIANAISDFAKEYNISINECATCKTITNKKIHIKNGLLINAVQCYGCIGERHIAVEYKYGFDAISAFASLVGIEFVNAVGGYVDAPYIGDE